MLSKEELLDKAEKYLTNTTLGPESRTQMAFAYMALADRAFWLTKAQREQAENRANGVQDR